MTSTRSNRWLARDLSHLYTEARTQGPPSFDVVIVGSGYGGAMAAAELAGRADGMGNPIRVLVLERGKEYNPGMFPSSGQELPTHIRFHRAQTGKTTGALDALLDLRLGPDVCALVGNGLGGGSLINAGVMEIPDWKTVPRLPASLTQELDPAYMNDVKVRLGARANGHDNTISGPGNFNPAPAKTVALQKLARAPDAKFHEAAVTIQLGAVQPGALWNRCEQCGDCMTGCNVGAKKSLDTTLLLEAKSRQADIVTGASVVGLQRDPQSGQWELSVIFTGESLRRRHRPLPIRADQVIVAAGALGSPELLMRSETFDLRFSPRLGQQFSCNGDNILALRDCGSATNSVADEYAPLAGRAVGPTITGVVQVAATESGPGFLLEEFAVPGSLKRIFEELVTTTGVLHELPECDRDTHVGTGENSRDPLAVDTERLKQAMVLGIVGHDESAGELSLPPTVRLDDSSALEGRIRINWPQLRKSTRIDDAFARTQDLLRRTAPGCSVLPNPMWRMLPDSMDFVLKSERGPLVTVHPLGGCPIGPNRDQGVVDEYGRVYDFGPHPSTSGFHDGLRVLDGSILPASLGANPGLTIAAAAQRAARQMAAQCEWVKTVEPVFPPRPSPARTLAQCTPPRPVATEIELIEKLCGPFHLGSRSYVAELTLRYLPQSVEHLTVDMARRLPVVQNDLSTLRIYDQRDWEQEGIAFLGESERTRHALLAAPVSGHLSLLQREASSSWWRVLRGGFAYLVNRGLRDAWTGFREIFRRKGWWRRLLGIASRAGEVRRFDYRLKAGPPTSAREPALERLLARQPDIVGFKRLTYSARGNPWRQLTELQLTEFLGQPRRARPLLTLDGRFMARQAVPLARIVKQENQVHALSELASFGLYFLRLILNIHLWSFRGPAPLPPRTVDLLPGPISGLPPPQIIEIELEPPRHGIAVLVRLSRYRGRDADNGECARLPLVLIHGYSASGSTFTHPSIEVPMARYFWERGRDVWVLDLRTSPGLPSAVLPWNFEDAALADIPVAIARILEVTKKPQVDVFAHCIGAVMLSMALLTDVTDDAQMEQINGGDQPDGVRPTRYCKQLAQLPRWIRRTVLSQKGPALVYSDGNVLRGYLMHVLRSLVLPQNYQFRAPEHPSVANQVLDRLLSSLPYPDDELRRENPLRPCARTPWVGFRHRLDALFARAFKLENMTAGTLAALEDLFGPLNLDTVSQAAHFARFHFITNGAGRNCFVQPDRVAQRWPSGQTLSIHGEENGLADVATLQAMQALMDRAGLTARFSSRVIRGYGHQDCIIGRGAAESVFAHVEEFLWRNP